MAVTFEGYERRIDKINKTLSEYGIKDIEEARQICLDKGINVEEIVKGVQPIAFENAVWAYTVGTAIAIKTNSKEAYKAAEMIGIGLQSFCIPGSVAERLAKEAEEAERAEAERLAAEAAEKERIAAEEAEKARLEAEKAEQERLEAERLAKEAEEKAEQERIAAEEAQKAAEEAQKAAEAERAEQERIALEQARAERAQRNATIKEKNDIAIAKKQELDNRKAAVEEKKAARLASMPLSEDPKSFRASPKPYDGEGMDESMIYGKYVTENSAGKYYFTLYDSKGNSLYESFNYSSDASAKSDINRFKKASVSGQSSIEESDEGGFFWRMKVGPRTFDGPICESKAEATNGLRKVKDFALTDISREQ